MERKSEPAARITESFFEHLSFPVNEFEREIVTKSIEYAVEECEAAFNARRSTGTIPRASICDADDPAYLDA